MDSTSLINISQNGNLPQIGVNIKKYLKPPPRSFSIACHSSRKMYVFRCSVFHLRSSNNQRWSSQPTKTQLCLSFWKKILSNIFCAAMLLLYLWTARRLLHSVFSLGGFPPSQFNSDPRGLLHFWEGIPVNLNIIPQKTGIKGHTQGFFG